MPKMLGLSGFWPTTEKQNEGKLITQKQIIKEIVYLVNGVNFVGTCSKQDMKRSNPVRKKCDLS